MDRRTRRWSVVVVLLGVAVGTGLFVGKQRDRIRPAEAALEDVSGRLDHLASLVRRVSDAQLRYLTLGLTESTPAAAHELAAVTADVHSLRGRLRAPGAEARLTTLANAAQVVAAVDARARENVRAGEMLMAADLVLAEATDAAASVEAEARALRSAELRTLTDERARMLEASLLAIGGTAVVWLIGVLMLVRVPRVTTTDTPLPAPREAEQAALPTPPPAPTRAEGPTPSPPTVDLAAAAALCTDIARATTTMALTELLSRASSVLGAPGMIVWMASGDELFAALGVGYDPRVVARLGTIHADAENATASAWRTGEMQTVKGDMVSRGAIVCPLFGPDGCLGVLAVEVPNGRDADPATRAVTTMIGAQLATILVAWPTAPQQQPDAPGLMAQGGALAPPLRVEA